MSAYTATGTGSVHVVQRPATDPALSRRRLLGSAATAMGGGLAAATLTGCGGGAAAGRATGGAGDTARTDPAAARRVAANAADLAARLTATVRAHRGLRTMLLPMARRHDDHLRAFTAEGDRVEGRAGGRVPADAKQALRELVGSERRAATAAKQAAVRVTSAELAAALASCAAGLAQHEVLLAQAVDELR